VNKQMSLDENIDAVFLEQAVMDHTMTNAVSVIVCDLDWVILWQNAGADDLIGPLVQKNLKFQAWHQMQVADAPGADRTNRLFKFECANGKSIWLNATYSRRGNLRILQLMDASDAGERLSEMSYKEGMWRNAIESAGHGVWDYNDKNEAMFCSDEWKRMRGFSIEQSVENDFGDWIARIHPDDVEYCLEQVRRHNEGEVEHFSFQYREKHTAGHYVWIHCSGRVVEWRPDGTASRILGTDVDISRIKEEESRSLEELRRAQQRSEAARQKAHVLSRQDPLTHLPNRRVFAHEIKKLSRQTETAVPFAVLAIDLDRFKPVNDLYGHATGDYVIQVAGKRLVESVGDLGTVTRLGGDEFGVILKPAASECAQLAEACANAVIHSINQPIQVGDFTVEIGASVGIALYPEHGEDPGTLFRHADMALYAIKQTERGTSKFYCDSMGHEAEAKAVLENAARHAVANNEIHPFFQPIFNIQTGRIQSFEVLSRWHSPELGDVPADQFIPIVDQFNLMPQFTMSILRKACDVAKSWPDHITLSINLTAKEVCDLSTPIRLFNVISSVGISPKRLKIEVTEQALLKDVFMAKQVIMAFRNAGVSVVLDDFGSGYAGLGYLRELKFDGIKIDRSFTASILRQSESATIVEAMQMLANKLGLETVAEGIEDEMTLNALRKIGCNAGQGYLFARAVSADEVSTLLDRESALHRKSA
jgi:diguanylate cyclase (GGDEF)-like protein/PAS domain S-box-containing protein